MDVVALQVVTVGDEATSASTACKILALTLKPTTCTAWLFRRLRRLPNTCTGISAVSWG